MRFFLIFKHCVFLVLFFSIMCFVSFCSKATRKQHYSFKVLQLPKESFFSLGRSNHVFFYAFMWNQLSSCVICEFCPLFDDVRKLFISFPTLYQSGVKSIKNSHFSKKKFGRKRSESQGNCLIWLSSKSKYLCLSWPAKCNRLTYILRNVRTSSIFVPNWGHFGHHFSQTFFCYSLHRRRRSCVCLISMNYALLYLKATSFTVFKSN